MTFSWLVKLLSLFSFYSTWLSKYAFFWGIKRLHMHPSIDLLHLSLAFHCPTYLSQQDWHKAGFTIHQLQRCAVVGHCCQVTEQVNPVMTWDLMVLPAGLWWRKHHGKVTHTPWPPCFNTAWGAWALGEAAHWLVCVVLYTTWKHEQTLCWQANFKSCHDFWWEGPWSIINSLKYYFAPHSGPLEVCLKWAVLTPILPLQEFTDSYMHAWYKTCKLSLAKWSVFSRLKIELL